MAPLRVKLVGLESLEVQVPWKPSVVFPPGASEPFQLRLVAVTAVPLWVTVALHDEVIRWSPGKLNRSVQPEMAVEPVLVTVAWATKPPAHSDCLT